MRVQGLTIKVSGTPTDGPNPLLSSADPLSSALLELRIDDRRISERIGRMNKRMEDEIGEPIITKYEGKWRLIKKLRRDFAAARREESEES